MDFSGFNAAEQAHMTKVIEKKQVRSLSLLPIWTTPPIADQMQDFMRMYSNLVERCFMSCCNDFTSKTLSSKEVGVHYLLCYGYPTCRTGAMHDELCRQVLKTFRASRRAVRGAECRCVNINFKGADNKTVLQRP
jgi:hypothetical protein